MILFVISEGLAKLFIRVIKQYFTAKNGFFSDDIL